MNRIQCTWSSAFKKTSITQACKKIGESGDKHTEPFECDSGYKICCTPSNIKNPKMDNFGTCHKTGETTDGGDDKCTADGEHVQMEMYKGKYGPQVDTTVESLCCSGVCANCNCISGTGLDEHGKQWFEGSCSGTCGAEGAVKESTA